MAVGTRKSNATKHPGEVITASKQQRRTRAQIEEDEARIKAATIAAKQNADAMHKSLITRVADIEDSMERDEEEIRAYSKRPDLRKSSKCPVAAKEITDLEHDSDVEDELELEDSESGDSEGETTPPGSTNARKSTASDQYIYSSCDSEVEDLEQADSSSGSTIQASTMRRKAKSQKKAEVKRGDFRKEVGAARHGSVSEAPAAGPASARDLGLKRTSSGRSSSQTIVAPKPKRLKRSYAFHEGLLQDWRRSLHKLPKPSRNEKKRLTMTQSNPGTDIEDGEDSGVPHEPGEFDQDEPEELLGKVKASKSSTRQVRASAISQRGGGPLVARKTEQMGVQIIRVDSTTKGGDSDAMAASHKNGRKQKYTTLDLPYPPGGKNSENWKLLNGMVLSWAGAQEDPFGTNGKLDEDIDTLWESAFPGSTLDAQGRKCALVVCGNSLNNWRSDIGKVGHQAALSMLHASDKYPHDKSACKRIISDALYGLRFLYEKPDDEVNRGPFCSTAISKVFAAHLQKVTLYSNHQMGGLALAAAAVERGLVLFKTGEDALELKEDKDSHCGKERGGSRNVRSRDLAFSEIPWGAAAREFMESIKKLEKSHWGDIYTHTADFMGRSDQITDYETQFSVDRKRSEENRPRARVQIDW